jgi:hypothetical protein
MGAIRMPLLEPLRGDFLIGVSFAAGMVVREERG